MKRLRSLTAFLAMLSLVRSTAWGGPGENEPLTNADIHPVNVEPMQYPLAGQLRQVQGIVVVRVHLNRAGAVESAEVLVGPSLLFGEAIENAKRWTFKPNRTSTAILIYDFRIEDACHLPCKSYSSFRAPNVLVIRTGTPLIR
jgi:TonB family protein